MNESLPQIFVGVDVSKKTLNVHIHPFKKAFTVPNSKVGINRMKRELEGYSVGQIVCEATGGYETLLATELNNVWVVEPKRIKAFIMSESVNAKTDDIDARMIAHFAAQKKPKHTLQPRSKEVEVVRALNQRRSDILEMINKESNRIQHPSQIHCKKELKKHISFLDKALIKIDCEIECLIKNNASLAKKAAIIQSVPGVGKVTAATLIGYLPELGTINDKEIAALVGVAPFDKQSGSFKGKSIIKGGRPEIRNVIYMAAVSAKKFNDPMKIFYERLIAAGKKPKVALVAIMRKLIIVLNAMIKKEQSWQA